MNGHRHRAIPGRTEERCWSSCVAPYTCPSEAAHGNIEHRDYCRCGAERRSEINGRHVTTAPWFAPKEEVNP